MGYIGGGVLLVVVGAILAFALEIDIPGIDDDMIGWIMMVAGLVLFVVGLVLSARSRRTTVAARTVDGGVPREHVTETRRSGDVPPQV
jgi:protein-S-isoprenylcysteine O-methyltransferase Ste14